MNTIDIDFKIKRKMGLKHTYIYVKSDNTVEVRTNYFVSKKKIFEFVKKKSNWIKKQQQKQISLPKEDIDKNQLKQQAKELILPLVEKWIKIMQVSPSFVGFRYNKTRWGSCSSKNRINFNTRLAMMNHEFVEYVVVHELAHIRHKNHSKEFWDEVENFLPDFKRRKKLI